ncbi:MAG: SpoIIIAH-like family protein [Clostridia bacterium]|jgi:hypothetical protein|nr:SpoIIIAH-like family protein [Clostridia bacterium]
MLSKKKKIFVLIGMVALLGAAACLNIFLNRNTDKQPADGSNVTYGSFFETYRADRQSTRDQTMLYYDAIIANEASSAEAIANAEAAKLALAKNMEVELVIEGLIKSLGFEDVVVTNTTENINVIVKSDELTKAEATQILEIITTETDKTALDVRLIPVE